MPKRRGDMPAVVGGGVECRQNHACELHQSAFNLSSEVVLVADSRRVSIRGADECHP